MPQPPSFVQDYHGIRIAVAQHVVYGQVVYRVNFSDSRAPLVITRASNSNAARFWTSLPEGRQREAEEIGRLIQQHFKTR